MLKALGALSFDTDNGALWAIFDDAGVRVDFPEGAVDSHAPQLTCLTSDVKRLELAAGAKIGRGDRAFTVRGKPLHDGTGHTTLILDEDK